MTIDFPHPVIGAQRGSYRSRARAFERELALGADLRLRARGRGAARDGADSRARRPRTRSCSTSTGWSRTTLRWPDEFVRHKTMDCVGDLALAGARVRARIVTRIKPSHRGTVSLVRAMQASLSRGRAGARNRRDHEGAAAPLSLPARRSHPRDRGRKRIVGLKNVTINEPFFQGHFPGHPIMPGVLIIEAMAQVGGMLLMGAVPDPENEGRVFHVAQQREVAATGEAGRPAPLRARSAAGARNDVQDVRESRRWTAQVVVRGRDGRDGARQMSARIHPTAIVDPSAEIGADVEIGAVRDRGRELHDRRRLRHRARARRSSATSCLGRDVKVGVGTVLGGDPQDLKYKGEHTTVEIGDGTTIREYTTINRGTTQSFKTTVGKDCFLMSYVHLAHDCHIGDGVIISNGTQLAGHVTIDEKAISQRPGRGAPVRDDRPLQLHRRLLARREGRSAVREGGRQPDQAVWPEQRRARAQRLSRGGAARAEARVSPVLQVGAESVAGARARRGRAASVSRRSQEFLAFFDRSDRGSVV